MNNQAKLRAVLLKWRAALAPVNYLDRIKQIKKGCKIFKRGLKKIKEKVKEKEKGKENSNNNSFNLKFQAKYFFHIN